jgi:hypothetical protein
MKDRQHSAVLLYDEGSARRIGTLRFCHQPVAHRGDRERRYSLVRPNISPAQIGERLSVAPSGSIQYEATFAWALSPSKLAAQEQPELEWHIVTRQTRSRIYLHVRKIVNPKPALVD